jgi:hypothetical protein
VKERRGGQQELRSAFGELWLPATLEVSFPHEKVFPFPVLVLVLIPFPVLVLVLVPVLVPVSVPVPVPFPVLVLVLVPVLVLIPVLVPVPALVPVPVPVPVARKKPPVSPLCVRTRATMSLSTRTIWWRNPASAASAEEGGGTGVPVAKNTTVVIG